MGQVDRISGAQPRVIRQPCWRGRQWCRVTRLAL